MTDKEENESLKQIETDPRKRSRFEDAQFKLIAQGFFGIALWMTFGLILEGLIGFRIPAYMTDKIRREMFQLAHTHGTLFGIVLVLVGVVIRQNNLVVSKIAVTALAVGSVLMPVAFLISGIWHQGEDPNSFIFLAPIGGIMMIFGVITVALSFFKK